MDDRKVFKFLKTFNKRQLNHFEDYVNSPYFNKSEELCFVFSISKKFVLSDTKKNYFDYFKKAFINAKKAITQKNLDKYLSRIYLLALDFVGQEKLKEKEFLKSSLLMEHLTDGDELGIFDKVYAKTKTILDKERLSFENLMNKYLLQSLNADYQSLQNEDKINKSNLQQATDALDDYYLSQKYYLEMAKQNIENVASQKFDYYLIEHIDKAIKTNFINRNVLLNLLMNIYRFKSSSNPTLLEFDNIKNLIMQSGAELDDEIAYNLTILITNLLSKVFKGKNKAFMKYSFSLFKELHSANLMYYKGAIYLTVFKNILDYGIVANELTWCKNFVEENSNRLTPKNIAIDMKNYALARLEFYDGNYNKASEYITKANFSGINFKLAVKRLETMIYYEMNEFFYLDSLIKAFRVAIIPKRSERLSSVNRELNKTFINWISKLIKIKTDIGTKCNGELLNEIEAKYIPNKLWLKEKIKEAILDRSK